MVARVALTMTHLVRLLVWKWQWLAWWFRSPYRLGDPLLGEGEVREKNRRILHDRYNAQEPQRPTSDSRG